MNNRAHNNIDEMIDNISFQTSNFIFKQKQAIFITIFILFLVGSTIVTFYYWNKKQKEDMNNDFYQIEKIYKSSVDTIQPFEKLKQVLKLNKIFEKNYPKAYQKNIIQYYIGKLYVNLNKLKDASPYFENVTYSVNADAPIKTLSAIELSHIYREENKANKAIQVLQSLETDFFAELKMFELAEAYLENKDKKQAEVYYKIFLKDYPNSTYKSYVEEKLSTIR